MPEIALNVAFDAQEIVQIVTEELQARMRNLSPLQGSKEYSSFSVDFQVTIRLIRSGESATDAKETLAWGKVERIGDSGEKGTIHMETVEDSSKFDSRDPNEERMARDMPLTVESSDGKGGKVRRKVKVKGA